jgi:hypothetical protein
LFWYLLPSIPAHASTMGNRSMSPIAAWAAMEIPLLGATGRPSSEISVQEYRLLPLTQLATRRASMAAEKASMGKFGTRKKPTFTGQSGTG